MSSTPRHGWRTRLAFTTLASVALLAAAATGDRADAATRWVPEHPAVINGSAVTPADFAGRWSAMAAVIASTSTSMSLCGGVLIDERTVLTAAHCTYSPGGSALAASNVDVVVGRRVASTTDGDRVPVASITRHPSFSRSTMRNDIAVLRLTRTPSVPFTPIPPTSLADESWWGAGHGRAVGSTSVGPWIAGWGAVNGSGSSFPAELQEAMLPIASDASCASPVAPGHGSSFDGSTMLCAGVPGAATGAGVDACQGDSGGPLIVGDGAGAWRVVGLTSWGRDCGGPYYGVYTRVGRYATWIEPLRYQPSPTPPADTSAPVPAAPPPTRPGAPPATGSAQPPAGSTSGSVPGPSPSTSAVGPLTLPAPSVTANRPPSRPTLLRVTARGRGWVTIAWRAARDDRRVVRYLVLVRGRHGTWRTWRTTARTRITLRLARGATTALRVRAIDGNRARSPMSGILRARPA